MFNTQIGNHLHASQMAHAAQRRLSIARSLGSKPASMPAPSFKAQAASMAHSSGAPASIQHVHAAIDSLTHKGMFTPFQGAALKQHNGPLVGPEGHRTIQAIATEMKTPKPPGAVAGPTGLPMPPGAV